MSDRPKPPLPSNWRELPVEDPRRKARVKWLRDHGRKPFKGKPEEKKKVTNDDITKENFEQYILSQNIDKAANYFTANSNLFNYRTFRQVKGDGAQLVNRLRGIDNLDVFYKIKTSTLSLMTPKVRIYKVNYEEFVLAEDGSPEQGKIETLPQPCYKEFKFSDNFGMETAATVQDYLTHESIKPNWRNIGLKNFTVTQDGKKHGIVENNIKCKLVLTFKSLKDLQASPPGEPHPDKGGLRYVDLITWAPSKIDRDTDTYNPKHYEIKVLLGYTAPSRQQLRSLNLTEKDVNAIENIEKLNIILSLALTGYDLKIKDNGEVEMHADYRGRLETTIGTNQVNIFQNTFRLTKDGAVDISRKANAKYNISKVYKLRTTLASVYRQLQLASCKDEKCKGRKTLKSLIQGDESEGSVGDDFFIAVLSEAFAVDDKLPDDSGLILSGRKDQIKIKGDGTEMFTFFKEKENMKKILAVIKKKIGLFKKDVYKTFVDQLIDGNTDGSDRRSEIAGLPQGHGTRLFCINVGSEEVEKSLGVVLEDKYVKNSPGMSEGGEGVQDEDNEILVEDAKGSAGIKIDRCHLVDPIDPAIANSVASEIASEIEGESAAKDDKEKKKEAHKEPARASIQDFSGKSHKFYFVYLGDIIELACKNAGLGKLDLKSSSGIRNEGLPVFSEETYFPKDEHNSSLGYPLKNARILLGPIEYYDDRGILRTINLAQFPISFNFFRAWFMKKVVRRKSSQMPLGSFITSLINTLVMPALGAGMPKSFKAPKTRSSLVSLTLPGKMSPRGPGEERKMCGRTLGHFVEAMPMQQVIDLQSAEFEQEYYSLAKQATASETLVKTSFDYLLIYVTTHKNIIERRGDPAEDVKDGIYHFNIGSDMGLLKNMTFKRVNIPHLVELRARESEEQGVDSLDQLKFPYNTNLVLAGTSLFTPGMFYYVNPSLAGLGSVEDAASLAYKMNLGGYHLVQTVTTKISAGKFETSIEGTQTSQGRR